MERNAPTQSDHGITSRHNTGIGAITTQGSDHKAMNMLDSARNRLISDCDDQQVIPNSCESSRAIGLGLKKSSESLGQLRRPPS